MTLPAIARALAIGLGILGAIDPVWPMMSPAPRAVDLRAASDSASAAVRIQLEKALKNEVTFASTEAPAARVIVGRITDVDADGVPTSFVSFDRIEGANTRVVRAKDPRPGLVGWRTAVDATIEGRGVQGSVSTVVLEQNGVELGRAQHTWTRANERADLAIPFVPASEGASRITLRLLPVADESGDDNVSDVRSVASSRHVSVLIHEPRPSWTAAFIRRVLESNPVFDVSATAIASKGLAVRTGTPPQELRDIDRFDVVIVGAPEELTSADVDALEGFARRRGGSIVIVPDRRPSGAYMRLLQTREFEEVLVEKPVVAKGVEGALQASELAIPRSGVAAVDVLASVDLEGAARPVVFSTPLGAGRVVFSGAMDAWRFRAVGDDDGNFARFWTSAIAGEALAAPAKLELSVEPGAVRPGEFVDVTLRLRRSELRDIGSRLDVPAVQARLTAASGGQEPVRFWPAAEPGAFVGRVRIPEAGKYDLQASTGTLTTDAVVIAAPDARRPDEARARREAIAGATGGVVANAGDLTPLVEALRALPAPQVTHDWHPTRSVWFVAAFAALLCLEWTMRRRTGLR